MSLKAYLLRLSYNDDVPVCWECGEPMSEWVHLESEGPDDDFKCTDCYKNNVPHGAGIQVYVQEWMGDYTLTEVFIPELMASDVDWITPPQCHKI